MHTNSLRLTDWLGKRIIHFDILLCLIYKEYEIFFNISLRNLKFYPVKWKKLVKLVVCNSMSVGSFLVAFLINDTFCNIFFFRNSNLTRWNGYINSNLQYILNILIVRATLVNSYHVNIEQNILFLRLIPLFLNLLLCSFLYALFQMSSLFELLPYIKKTTIPQKLWVPQIKLWFLKKIWMSHKIFSQI